MKESLGKRMEQVLLEDMLKSLNIHGESPEWRTLVLDPQTTKVLSSVLTMSGMQSQGISHVEDLTKGRQALQLEAVYFITPSASSVNHLLEDYSGDKPLYTAAHVYFSSKISSENLSQIKDCRKLVSKLKTLKEINMEVVSLDSRTFITNQPNCLNTFFGDGAQRHSPEYANELSSMVKKLSTVFATLKEFPTIRYRQPTGLTSGSKLAADLATSLDEALLDFHTQKLIPEPDSCDLLILDRGYDPVAPVIHEWTYEAMIYDLLEMDGNIYKPSTSGEGEVTAKEVILGEHDELWGELRHLHIAQASVEVNDKMEEFRKKNVAARLGSKATGQVSSAVEMRKLIQALPEYRDFISRLSLHVDITHDLFKATNERHLKEMGELEQDLVYGDKHSKDIMTWLQANKGAHPQDKMRLFMCYFATHPEKMDRERRTQWQRLAQLNDKDMNTLLHLEKLGVAITKKDGSGLLSFARKKKKATRKERENDKLSQQYALARFQPLLMDLLEDLVGNQLPVDAFPYIREPSAKGTVESVASVRSNTFSWAKKQKDSSRESGSITPSFRRLVVFVIGGVTRSEMRIAHKLSKSLSRDIIIGGTHPDTPHSFMASLSQLGSTSSDMVTLNVASA